MLTGISLLIIIYEESIMSEYYEILVIPRKWNSFQHIQSFFGTSSATTICNFLWPLLIGWISSWYFLSRLLDCSHSLHSFDDFLGSAHTECKLQDTPQQQKGWICLKDFFSLDRELYNLKAWYFLGEAALQGCSSKTSFLDLEELGQSVRA